MWEELFTDRHPQETQMHTKREYRHTIGPVRDMKRSWILSNMSNSLRHSSEKIVPCSFKHCTETMQTVRRFFNKGCKSKSLILMLSWMIKNRHFYQLSGVMSVSLCHVKEIQRCLLPILCHVCLPLKCEKYKLLHLWKMYLSRNIKTT